MDCLYLLTKWKWEANEIHNKGIIFNFEYIYIGYKYKPSPDFVGKYLCTQSVKLTSYNHHYHPPIPYTPPPFPILLYYSLHSTVNTSMVITQPQYIHSHFTIQNSSRTPWCMHVCMYVCCMLLYVCQCIYQKINKNAHLYKLMHVTYGFRYWALRERERGKHDPTADWWCPQDKT